MNYEDFIKHRWLAVYGAMIAAQVTERVREGRGAPDDIVMQDFKEEAAAVADMDAKGNAP